MASRIHHLACALAFAVAACGGADIPARPDGAPGEADAAPGTPDAGIDAATMCSQPPPAPAQCDFFLSCGCNVQAGEKCSIDANNSMHACFQAGTKQPGDDCSVESDCAAVSLCAIYGSSGPKRCMQYCDDAHPCPTSPQPQACYIPVANVADAKVCGQVCNLLGQDCELTDEGCYPSSRVHIPESGICAHAKAGGDGDTCAIANDCNKGLTCLSGDSKCHKLCRVGGGEPSCTVGDCQALSGSTITGVCK